MKWVKRVALVLLGVVLGAGIALYGWTEWALRRDIGVPLHAIVADRSPAGIAEGARLAHIDGCMSCHEGGHGGHFIDKPVFAVLDAPSFASLTAHESDAQLARSIRQGVTGDGRQLFIMPPHPTMADDDVAKVIGFLRTLPASPQDVVRRRSFGPLGRIAILTGGAPATAHPPLAGYAHRPADMGAYFAQGTCLGCHRMDEAHEVRPGDVAPPLSLAASYDDAAFERLLRTGVGLSKPDLGLMSGAARGGLHLFTDDEIAAIHHYIEARAAAQPAS